MISAILNSNLTDTQKVQLIAMYQQGGAPDKLQPKKEKTITTTETIRIGKQEFDVAVADTPELRAKGLEPYSYLREDEGMLFIFDAPTTSTFTMKNCGIDLDIVFIDDDGEVVDIKSGRAYDQRPIQCQEPYQFVLEVNRDSGISIGEQLDQEGEEFDADDKEVLQRNRMLVLDSNGDVQMRLYGGERIFSRIFTRKMIKAAIKAYKSDEDADYRKVGKLVMNELDAQDNREPEYTQLEK